MARRRKRPTMSDDPKGASCPYCHRVMESSRSVSKLAATRDHVHPKSLGGTYRIWCCQACNTIKASKTPAEWSLYMRENPEWWKSLRQTFAERRAIAMAIPRPSPASGSD